MKSSTKAKRVSIHEVARRSGCSIATVSNVLNAKGRVGDEQRDAVLKAVKDLHYVPDVSGRSLRLGRTESVGLLFYPSCARLFRNPFYAQVMEGLEEEFANHRHHVLLAGFEPSELQAKSSAHLLQGRVDAIALLGAFPYEIIQSLSHHPKPLVLIDTDADDLPLDSVVSDGLNSSRAVVSHLAELGHQRLLMVAYKMEDYNIDMRVRGFQQGLRQHRLPHGPETVMRDHLFNADICPAVLERLAAPEPPTAIYAINDTMAFALKAALERAGYRVPQDVSLVGFDDDEFSPISPVEFDRHLLSTAIESSLTTIHVDRKALGRTGAELCVRRIKKPDAPTSKLRLATKLMVRGSTGPGPRSA